MPIATFPLLTVFPALPQKGLQELKKILDIVVVGAFGQQTNFRTTLAEHSDHAVLEIEFLSEVQQCSSFEIVIRVAETMLQLIAMSARKLGVSARQSNIPSRRALKISGLTWHHARLRLANLVCTRDLPPLIQLRSSNTDLFLQIRTDLSLGYSTPSDAYLCTTVICQRTTPAGVVVRIRCERRSMSIAIPHGERADCIYNGAVISTAPIAGLIPRRLVQIRRCQNSLFSEYCA